jgi:outer membrane lipoprotein-sorting protein
MARAFFFILLMISTLSSIFAQNSRDVDNSAETSSQNKKSVKVFKSEKNSFFKTQKEGKEEYEDRMKQVVKDKKKSVKILKKPQYSDKSYFGHKRPPKKRALSKRKLCKVCGIVH